MNTLTRARVIFTKLSVRFHSGKVGIIGVPFNKGQKKEGVARGPETIRAAGLIKELQVLGLDVRDYGDVNYDKEDIHDVNNMSHLSHVASCTSRLSECVQQVIRDDRQVVTIGGDHSVVIGTIDGHIKEKQDVAVIWVDAHADLNTNKTSDSGNVHGMPAALLISELSDYWPYLPGMDWQKPMLPIRNLAYIGLRSVDRYERLVIEKHGITAFGIEDIEHYGIHNVFHMALNKIDPHNEKSLHVSFDIDSLDPLEAPSTGTPVRGGLYLREAIHLMEQIYRTHRLSAIDLVEVNPQIGDARDIKITVEAAIHVIQAALGHMRRGLTVPKGVTDIPLQTFR
ncbi:arginase, hepatic isoform X2 [Harpegnathos saltator]|uniref:Arginase n=1 Tax=Harpegnathos saltator TaxID=610380 RepID=E2BK89_HARSA|nr:arginase, hepatic isoform X2 [Harpegnathos saltator]EFN83886.1 Arginase-2, mitochondrial [Harpegnathos saltator]